MDKGWNELESDPGLFTLLLEDFGVNGVQVEEIYDLQKSIEGTVYGFIFLFKWIEERRSRRKINQEEESFVTDEEIVSSMFFAQQMIPNSCATHALVSVLLNTEKVALGDTLTKLKQFSRKMNPEDKGFAIGNLPALAKAHNSHARPEAPRRQEKQQGISTVRTMEAFHFVSYVPINGRLFELDGLKPYPIDHGPWGENEEWTEKFRRVITERLGMATGGEPYHDIRFCLMAVVPDRRQHYEVKLKTLKTNRQIVLEALQQLLDSKMVKVTTPELTAEGKSLRGKAEPILTRSVAAAAREALASHAAEKEASRRHGKRSSLTDTEAELAAMANTSSDNPAKLPTALDCHSYAKSPILDSSASESKEDADEDVEMTDVKDDQGVLNTASGEKVSISQLKDQTIMPIKGNQVKIEISVADDTSGTCSTPISVANTDITKPLLINTKFVGTSPGPGSESTDTASEVGSFLSSPNGSSTTSAHSSPNTSFLKHLANKAELEVMPDKMQIGEEALLKVKADLEGHLCSTPMKSDSGKLSMITPSDGKFEGKILDEKLSPRSAKSKFSSAHGFTPKDLLALLKNVDNEISVTEQNLRDEVEKRKKYKADDCRRTHNYDQFICTFLSMLAEQGHLAGLVEQHMLIKRRQGFTASSNSHKIRKPDRRKRSRPKPKKKR